MFCSSDPEACSLIWTRSLWTVSYSRQAGLLLIPCMFAGTQESTTFDLPCGKLPQPVSWIEILFTCPSRDSLSTLVWSRRAAHGQSDVQVLHVWFEETHAVNSQLCTYVQAGVRFQPVGVLQVMNQCCLAAAQLLYPWTLCTSHLHSQLCSPSLAASRSLLLPGNSVTTHLIGI